MAESLAEIAARITCTACAVATGSVHVISFNPFVVNPPNLLQLTFKNVNIDDDARLAIFRKAASQLSPEGVQASILGQAIDPASQISDFADFLEALLAKDELGG